VREKEKKFQSVDNIHIYISIQSHDLLSKQKNKQFDTKYFYVFRYLLFEKMRLIILFTVVCISLVTSSPVSLGDGFTIPSIENVETHINNLWTSFKNGYGLVYNTSLEEMHRLRIFTNNVKMIIQHNIEHDLGLHTYRLGVNKFAAMVKRK